MEKQWYAAFTQTGEEDNVKTRLYKNLPDDFRFIVPKRVLKERRSGIWKEVTRTIFPGYILIEGSIDTKSNIAIRNTMGLVKILELEGEPLTIHPHEIDIINRLTMNEELIKASKGYFEGDEIVITDGPLKGNEGLIESINKRKGRAKVKLNFFGETRVIELGIELLKERH